MKKVTFSLLAVLALCSCQKKELECNVSDSKPFTAVIEDSYFNDTKTSLDEYGNVLWKRGDQVSIFAGSTINEQYQVTDASDGQTSASLNRVTSPGFNAGGEIDNNVAFYPYASTNAIAKNVDGYTVRTTLHATQIYAVSSFGNGAFPMAAVTSSTSDMNLKFKNILGGLKLQLKGTAKIASISVSGNNGEILCGTADVAVSSSSVPSISMTGSTGKTVTLDCGEGVQLDASTAASFIIALPPLTMTGGFTVTVVDTGGKQMEIKTTKSQTITRSSVLKMPQVTYEGVPVICYADQPFTITSSGSTQVSILREGTPNDITLEYKEGEDNWISYTIGTEINLADGESVQFRAGNQGNSSFSTTIGKFYHVSSHGVGSIIVSGNILSLLNIEMSQTDLPHHCFYALFKDCDNLTAASNLILPAITPALYCYCDMFNGCKNLISAPKLPATTIGHGCYYDMFNGCTSLINAPDLPATTIAEHSYHGMFNGCTSLINAPKLPATTIAECCYYDMFNGCTSLINAPELPATTIGDYCYHGMFENCTSLVSAPELPATTLASNCYTAMFNGCTSLINAPDLPATTIAESCCDRMFMNCTSLINAPEKLPATTLASFCYQRMFEGCESLTNAPELPATVLADRCYQGMFAGCKNLNSVPEKLPATDLAYMCYSEMFRDCTSLVNAPELPATMLPSWCYYMMFSGCTRLVNAPDLPATILSDSCYREMFYNCRSLVIAPDLPATILVPWCYYKMFYGCINLEYIKMLAISIPAVTCIDAWMYGVSTSGTFVKNGSATWTMYGVVPSGWTVLTEF